MPKVLPFLLALAAFLPASALEAASSIPHLEFADVRLDNGLRVLIAPDHTAPVFGISVTYNVGSRDERPGRTGFAHLFEHMMFQGSENVGKGEHFILVLNNGGGMNGTTSEDRTNYYETLPKNQLDLALFLESDRMRSLAVNPANLDNQRNAVQEERRRGIDNEAYGKSELEVANLAYDNFAYKHSTIGEMSDLDAATLQDLKDFFRIYYAPGNAVLALVGDLDPAEALQKVKKYFGSIPAQPAPPPVDMTEPEHYGARREIIVDPLARQARVDVSHQIPKGGSPENDAFQVLEHILGAGNSSRLYQHLVKEKQLATSVSAGAEMRRGPSLFTITAMVRPGIAPEDVEKAIADELEALKQGGVDKSELDKARVQFKRERVSSLQTALGAAIELGEFAVRFGDPELINTFFSRFSAVTGEQAKAAARKYLTDSSKSSVVTLPGADEGGK